jgi:hypothetical protein
MTRQEPQGRRGAGVEGGKVQDWIILKTECIAEGASVINVSHSLRPLMHACSEWICDSLHSV